MTYSHTHAYTGVDWKVHSLTIKEWCWSYEILKALIWPLPINTCSNPRPVKLKSDSSKKNSNVTTSDFSWSFDIVVLSGICIKKGLASKDNCPDMAATLDDDTAGLSTVKWAAKFRRYQETCRWHMFWTSWNCYHRGKHRVHQMLMNPRRLAINETVNAISISRKESWEYFTNWNWHDQSFWSFSVSRSNTHQLITWIVPNPT